ncbi:MAG TPA: hypothetical protein VNU19_09990, partial [Candidatus Acidoferrum sp.]|nr:hypothetical protein [Candidatus Acidoferrum sp.]
LALSADIPYSIRNPERGGFEPSWRVTPPAAFPGLRSQVQSRAHEGIAYFGIPSLRALRGSNGELKRIGAVSGFGISVRIRAPT